MVDIGVYIYYHLHNDYDRRLDRMVVDKHRECSYIVVIDDVQFIWDPEKSISNKAKHGVTFEEAATVFSDWLYLEMADPDHSQDEERFVALGISKNCRLLVVCHAVLQDSEIVRIISARQATANEECQYGGKTNAGRI